MFSFVITKLALGQFCIWLNKKNRFAWEALVPFERLLLTSKNILLLCRWKCCRVPFLLMRHVYPVVIWFVTNKYFFPSLLLVFKLHYFILLISNFWYWLFCRIFICFQFYSSILIYQILYCPIWSFFLPCSLYKSFIGFQFHQSIQIDCIIFSIWSLLFWFLIFFSCSFCKSYYSFQFHPPIKIFFLFFMLILILILLIFFCPFSKLIFVFNFTL
jgi:hypothetical protein